MQVAFDQPLQAQAVEAGHVVADVDRVVVREILALMVERLPRRVFPCTAKAPRLISGAMDEIATPHDTFFRESFSRREIALDFLRHHLPAELLAEIDLVTLEISKDTYVSADLRSAYSDLVYRVRHRDGPLTIYVLFEHKSSPEHWTALQLLRYLVAEGDAYRKQHPQARGSRRSIRW